jgi:hypothetical protein
VEERSSQILHYMKRKVSRARILTQYDLTVGVSEKTEEPFQIQINYTGRIVVFDMAINPRQINMDCVH